MAKVMEQSTSKMENFTNSTHGRKRKADLKITSDTEQKKKRVHETDKIFGNWINMWKQKSCKYTSVDFSTHSSNNEKSMNFIMISQNSMSSKGKNQIIIHYKNVPLAVEHLQKCYAEIVSGNVSLEAEEKSIAEETSLSSKEDNMEIGLYKKNLAMIYSQMMNNLFFRTSNKFCEGCEMDYPSQRDHDCLTMSVQDRIEMLFDFLFNSIDEENAHVLCIEKLTKQGYTSKFKQLPKSLLDDDWKEELKVLLYESVSGENLN